MDAQGRTSPQPAPDTGVLINGLVAEVRNLLAYIHSIFLSTFWGAHPLFALQPPPEPQLPAPQPATAAEPDCASLDPRIICGSFDWLLNDGGICTRQHPMTLPCQ